MTTIGHEITQAEIISFLLIITVINSDLFETLQKVTLSNLQDKH